MLPDFHKYEALGNDYLVIRPGLLGDNPEPAAIRAICDRNRGAGSDGILLGSTGPDGSLFLRIFNPDGSEAEKSGNGLRIYARYVFETLPEHPREFPISTKGGLGRASILADAGNLVRIDMGKPDFATGPHGAPGKLDEAAIFAGERCSITCVSMGNPHCVVRGLPVDAATARRVGPFVENAPRFPKRTNVQFLEVVSRDEIRIEIWERGAGYTLASGSSSCAAAAVARRLGLVGEVVRVRMPGGTIEIEFKNDNALMTGPVEKVYEGVFSREFLARIGLPC